MLHQRKSISLKAASLTTASLTTASTNCFQNARNLFTGFKEVCRQHFFLILVLIALFAASATMTAAGAALEEKSSGNLWLWSNRICFAGAVGILCQMIMLAHRRSWRRRVSLAAKRTLWQLPTIAICLVLLAAAGAVAPPVGAQTATPTPTPPPQQQVAMSLANNLSDYTNEAIAARQAFILNVERPLSGWFYAVAQLLALIMFSWAIAAGITVNGGFTPIEVYSIGMRSGVGFLLLFLAGDVDADGNRGDLINVPAAVGYCTAYGVCDRASVATPVGTFFARQVNEQETQFNANYQRFVENKFMVRVAGRDLPVAYPTAGDTQMLAALYTGTPLNQEQVDKAKSREWQMSWLYWTFNTSRGLFSAGDFFLFFLQGFAVIALRLALPIYLAVFFYKEYAQKITLGFFFTAFVWTIIFPLMCQFLRWVFFGAANTALGIGGNNPYYAYDATTGKIIANGNPEVVVAVGAAYMFFGALCLFAAPMLAMYFSQGKMLEGFVTTVSGWFTALSSIGLSAVVGAAGQRLNTEADRVGIEAGKNAAYAEGDYTKQAAIASGKASSEASQISADYSKEATRVGADFNRAADIKQTEGAFQAGKVSAFAGYVDRIANLQTEAYQSKAQALLTKRQEWGNLDIEEKKERLSNQIDLAAKNGDAEAKNLQQMIRDEPERLDLMSKQLDGYLAGVPVVGSGLKAVGINGDAFNTWMRTEAGRRAAGTAVGVIGSNVGGLGVGGVPFNAGDVSNQALQQVDPGAGLQGIFSENSLAKARAADQLAIAGMQQSQGGLPLNASGIGQQSNALPETTPNSRGGGGLKMNPKQRENYQALERLKQQDPNFIKGVHEMSRRNNWNPDEVLDTMAFESSFNKSARGGDASKVAGGNFVGLIQFGEKARVEVGLPRDVHAAQAKLSQMTATQQLPFVEKYLQNAERASGLKFNKPGYVYGAVAGGSGTLQKAAKHDGVLFTRGSKQYHAGSNERWDANGDGKTTIGEMSQVSSNRLGAGVMFTTNALGEIRRTDPAAAKVLSANKARQLEFNHSMAQNQALYEAKENVTTGIYNEKRGLAVAKNEESNQITDNVAGMRGQAATSNYQYGVQSLEITRQSGLQSAELKQRGAYQAADLQQRGAYQAANRQFEGVQQSADLAYRGRTLAADIQYQASLEASHKRALASMIQQIGSTASSQLSEASEKFNRL